MHKILVLSGSKVEKHVFPHFCVKTIKIYHVIWIHEVNWPPSLFFPGRQFYADSK